MQRRARERQRPRLSTALLIGLLTLILLASCGTDEIEPGATAEDLPQVALSLIEEAVAQRNPTDWPIGDAVAWVRRELPDLAVAAWAAQLPGDTGVEQARAREQWTARVRADPVPTTRGRGHPRGTGGGRRPTRIRAASGCLRTSASTPISSTSALSSHALRGVQRGGLGDRSRHVGRAPPTALPALRGCWDGYVPTSADANVAANAIGRSGPEMAPGARREWRERRDSNPRPPA